MSLSPNSWLKIDAVSPRPKTPILWLDVSIALPVRVLPFGIGTFTPNTTFLPSFWKCVDLGVCVPLSMRLSKGYPYLLGQIGLVGNIIDAPSCITIARFPLPIRSNRISWKLINFVGRFPVFKTLPIRSNRISWKQFSRSSNRKRIIFPYLLGQIGLVGNSFIKFCV